MTASDTSVAGSTLPTTGQALRALREAQGLTPEDVSSRIKFSPRQIRALESEDWAALPTGVSLRGLVRSYARLLGADAESLVATVAPQVGAHSMRPEEDAQVRQGRAVMASRVPMVAADDVGGGISWGWLVIILAFVGAGIAYAFWQGWLPQHWLPAGWF
ncbi:MAG: helix-turn-helix domain-containing protein [Comamonadaceae bacterium]|nr:MAG: helix-turn-helix domain-containing protein [Comamonadaceae bacterium]